MKKIVFLLLIVSSHTFAGQNSYSCFVKTSGNVNQDGDIESSTLSRKSTSSILNSYAGSTFEIDRKSGSIKGEIVTNQTPNVVSTTVLNNKTGSNSYQVLSTFGPNPSILYIRVEDISYRQNSELIPFSGYRWGEFFTGVCK